MGLLLLIIGLLIFFAIIKFAFKIAATSAKLTFKLTMACMFLLVIAAAMGGGGLR